MEVYDFIKKRSTRIMVIWLSCFDKARTIEEIGKIWGYSASRVLHLENIPSKMLECKLLKVEKLERKQIYFRSSFEIYPELLKKLSEEVQAEASKDFYENFLKNSEVLMKVIDSEEYKQLFLDAYLIKRICGNNRNFAGDYLNALAIPLLGLIFLTVMKLIEKNFPKINFEIIKKTHFEIFYNLFFPVVLNMKEYSKVVKEKLDKKTFDKLTRELESTELFKKYAKFTGMFKFLAENVINSNLFKSEI